MGKCPILGSGHYLRQGAVEFIARTQNVPPSIIANYIFAPPLNLCTEILPPPLIDHKDLYVLRGPPGFAIGKPE